MRDWLGVLIPHLQSLIPIMMKPSFWRYCVSVVLLGATLASCVPQSPPAAPTAGVPAARATPVPPAGAPTSAPSSDTAKPTPLDMQMLDVLARPTLARGYLTTPNELARIARLAQASVEPYKSAVAAELKYAAQARAGAPLRLPKQIDIRDDNVENPQYLHDAAKYVYAWA